MMTRQTLLSILCVTGIFLPALAFAQSETHIVIIGDTTASNSTSPALGWGWGQYVEGQTTNAKVFNFATPGKSTKTFLDSPAWKSAISTPAQYWLIQFGANDARKSDPRYTDPSGDFKDYLRQFIAKCREMGAKPILVTSPQVLGSDRKTPQRTIAPYVMAAREVAAEEKVPLIDLYDWTGRWYKDVGDGNLDTIFVEKSTAYYTADGAKQIARYIATELARLDPQIQLADAAKK